MKKVILIPIFFVGVAALVTWILMLLWNWLMPDIFNLTTITFWQALGLLGLSKLLFGGMHGGKRYSSSKCTCHKNGHKQRWKDKFKNKWEHMSDHDKQKWEAKFAGTPWCNDAINKEASSETQRPTSS